MPRERSPLLPPHPPPPRERDYRYSRPHSSYEARRRPSYASGDTIAPRDSMSMVSSSSTGSSKSATTQPSRASQSRQRITERSAESSEPRPSRSSHGSESHKLLSKPRRLPLVEEFSARPKAHTRHAPDAQGTDRSSLRKQRELGILRQEEEAYARGALDPHGTYPALSDTTSLAPSAVYQPPRRGGGDLRLARQSNASHRRPARLRTEVYVRYS